MNAARVGGYRLKLANWDDFALSVLQGDKPSDDAWEGKVVVACPEMKIDDEPYIVSLEMRPALARKLARKLSRAANLIDPPKAKVKRG